MRLTLPLPPIVSLVWQWPTWTDTHLTCAPLVHPITLQVLPPHPKCFRKMCEINQKGLRSAPHRWHTAFSRPPFYCSLPPLFCIPADDSLYLFLMTATPSQIPANLPACHTCSWRSARGDQPLILAARKTAPGAIRYANKQLTRLLDKVPPGIPLQLAQQEQV